MKLLDLFCCGGGAGFGYELAGFDVTGVDIEPQPKHRGKFVLSDALEYVRNHGHEYDAIHASPPCQAYTMAAQQWRLEGKEYPDLIAATRAALINTGLPYIIENVPGSPLESPFVLCGSMFGMMTYRHRLFEANFAIDVPAHPHHVAKNAKMGREYLQYVGHFSGVPMARAMTGLHWLGQYELAQSIPPQYTNFIGEQLMKVLSMPAIAPKDASA
jgi:DNA (cytosine-5)-methyltransferase 1